MKRTNWWIVAAIAVCILLPAIVAQAKDKVLRPLYMQAQTQQVWQLDANGAPVKFISAGGWGVSTHCGLFYTAPFGATPENGFLSGYMISANGDQIFYIWPVGNFLDVTITGGTGRFSGATGEFTLNATQSVSDDPETLIRTITLTWTAFGTISY